MTKQITTLLRITADDFGLDQTANRGIIACVRDKSICAISIGTCGEALFAEDITELQLLTAAKPAIAIGIHLMLTDGTPRSDSLKKVFTDGTFPRSYKELICFWPRLLLHRKQVEAEWDCQIQQLINYGIAPRHLDSHHHIHLLPGLWPVAKKLAKKYNIKTVRTGYQSIGGALASRSIEHVVFQILCAVRYGCALNQEKMFGAFCSGCFTIDAVLKPLLVHLQQGKKCELMVHPALGGKPSQQKEIGELKQLDAILQMHFSVDKQKS